jgi:hypothetical protein
MKKNIKKYLIVCFCLVLCLYLFVGCGKRNNALDKPTASNQSEQVSASPESSDAATEDVTATATPEATTSPDANMKDDTTGKTKELPIYTINDESLEAQAAVALIPEESEITADLIVKTVVENLKDHSLIVGIDKVTVDKERVIVSFLYDSAPLTTVGSGVEATILDCISGSLLDNLDSCKQVIFRAEGKSYESGHIVLGFDEAYAWK